MSDRRKHAAKPGPRLRLEWVEAGSLTANPRNWRKHPETQMAAIKGLSQPGVQAGDVKRVNVSCRGQLLE